jgi:hypothetical protein
MKKAILLFLLFWAIQLFAVEKSLVSVKNSTVSSDVVIVTITESGKTYELQCTKTAPFCQSPAAGTYWMVRLPKNHGVYDCDNVDLYLQSADPENGGKALGEYCISVK